MKRTSFSVLLSALWCIPVFSQDLAKYDLKGPVKSFTEKSYRAEQKGKTYVPTMHAWLNDLGSDNLVRFDEKGRHAYTALLTDDGSEYQEETYDYSGDRLVYLHSWYNETEYKYDAAGLLTEAISHGHGLGTDMYYVNVGGKPAEIWSVSTEGDTLAHELLEFDAKGNLLKQYAVPFSSADFSGFETTFAYDADGHVIRQAVLSPYSNWVQETTYVKGRRTQQTISNYSEGMLTDTDELVFNKKGLLAEKKIYQMIDPLNVNQLELKQTQQYTYTFDKKGNWTKMVITVTEPGAEGKDVFFVVEREIMYF